jgi:hypothetical protein
MKKQLHIIAINASSDNNPRKLLEQLEGQTFKNIVKLRKELPKDASVYPITEFMDDFNNDEVNSIEFFIGYVWLKE